MSATSTHKKAPGSVPAPRADPSPPRVPRRAIEGGSADERRAFGRSLRSSVRRAAHAGWTAPADRPDPVALLMEQSATRIADLVPVRYGRMLVSPFTFYRGAALVMAADLARLPSTGLYVQSCGDAHLSNFGVFATPERRLAFDVNDFDETHPAPFEWDVKRLAASVVVACRAKSFPDKAGRRMTRAAVAAYRTRLAELAEMTFLEAWYTRIDISAMAQELEARGSKAEKKRVKRWMEKTATRTNLGSLDRLAERTSDGWRLREEPPIVVRTGLDEQTMGVVGEALRGYLGSLRQDLQPIVESYRFADVARKVVGVGSVGTAAYVMLCIGNRQDDALFLQLKEAPPSVLEPYTEPSAFEHQGERVVTGQRLMQAASDQFLGWLRIEGLHRPYDFYVRQLRDWKASFEVESADEASLTRYVRTCAQALAQAHARSGSASAISGYLGSSTVFDEAIEQFAVDYADQTDRDYAALQQAEVDGRIEVRRGV